MALFPWDRDAMRNGGPPGLGLALFAGILITGMLCGLGGMVLSGMTLVQDAQARRALVEDGIVPEGSFVEAVLDVSGDGSGRQGCLVADNVLIRWQDRQRQAAVALDGAEISRDGPDLVVSAVGEAVRCPIGRGAEAQLFEQLVTLRSRNPRPQRRLAEPTDPRLRRHLGLDEDPADP